MHVSLIVILLATPFTAAAGEGITDVLAFRNHNPFLQIYGVPVFQSATLATRGYLKYDINAELTNHADSGADATELFVVDGETYALGLSLRRRMSDRLELGIDFPFISHQGGFLDNIIKQWHDVLGVSNSNRSGPDDELEFLYQAAGVTQYELSSSSSGIGDVQLTAAWSLKKAGAGGGSAFTVRSSVKLPSGDEEKLLGSGATDFSLGLYASSTSTFLGRDLGLSGFVGVLALGDGDVLPDIQRSTVPFGGVAAKWQAMERLGIVMQVYAQGQYFDSDLEELGGKTFQLGIGLDYRLRRQGMSLALSIAEDPLSDATPDFAIQLSLRSSGGGSAD
jgi:hypothetical protein